MFVRNLTESATPPLPRRLSRLLSPLIVALAVATAQAADKSPSDKAGKKSEASPAAAAIRASEQAFVAAFNRGDAKAVAALWTANGSLADEQGQVYKGRKAIEDEYATFFLANAGAQDRSGHSVDRNAHGRHGD